MPQENAPKRPRKPPAAKITPRLAESMRRENQVVTLRAAGASEAQIAEQLGYANEGGVSKALHRALERRPAEDIEFLRKIEDVRLSDLHRRALEAAVRSHPILYQGQPVYIVDAQGRRVMLEDDGPRIAALTLALKAQESYRKLHGLDAPRQVEVSGRADGVPVPVEVRLASVEEKWRGLRALPPASGPS